jgi:hypothetical protein
MTIIEAINRIDTLKPNSYTQQEKIKWLSTLDGIIKNEIIDTHKGGENISFNGYNENTLLTTELLVPAPYDEVYLYWLESKIDYYTGETQKYNNSISMFNTAYSNYEKIYTRDNMPIRKKPRFIF